jgi:hypothetical protein
LGSHGAVRQENKMKKHNIISGQYAKRHKWNLYHLVQTQYDKTLKTYQLTKKHAPEENEIYQQFDFYKALRKYNYEEA